ncbi:MAG: response regulator [Saprospiraceae bacterium]
MSVLRSTRFEVSVISGAIKEFAKKWLDPGIGPVFGYLELPKSSIAYCHFFLIHNPIRLIQTETMIMQHTILIVEDYDSLRQLLGAYLSKQYNIVGAKDGLEALSWLHKGLMPDAIITDLQMPEIDGLTFIANLRNSGIYRHIPLIVITGEKSEDDERRCRQFGVHAFVHKPFNPVILDQHLEQLFASSELSRATA